MKILLYAITQDLSEKKDVRCGIPKYDTVQECGVKSNQDSSEVKSNRALKHNILVKPFDTAVVTRFDFS